MRKLKEVEIEDDGLTTLDEAIEIFYRTLEEFLSHPALTLEFKRNWTSSISTQTYVHFKTDTYNLIQSAVVTRESILSTMIFDQKIFP